MGASKQANSVASRLKAMRPGDREIFVAPPGMSKNSKQRAIAADLHKAFGPAKVEFTTKVALLVIDETELPLAVVLVHRKEKDNATEG